MNKKKIKPAKAETYLSLLIILLLVGIGAGIFLKQFSYNPAVLSKPIMPSGTVQAAPDAKTAAVSWADFLPSMLPLTPPEVFEAANLSDKINGKAELYLAAGFKQLQCQRFKTAADPDMWMEIFVYDMGRLQNAFAVFSGQRRENASPTGLAPFSYQTPNTLFLIHGPFYVEVIASMASDALSEQMKVFARNFIENTRVDAESMPELTRFPLENLDKNSLALIAVDAFGYDQFNRIFTANYKMGTGLVTAFISRRESPAAATQLMQGYLEFLSAYGGKSLDPSPLSDEIKIVEIMGAYELFFAQGPYLAGVHEAADKGRAEKLAEQLNQALKAGVHEQR